ncbi:MAG: DNA polymerase III subunit gamma/tau [Rhodothermales bacterium]|nr:DNA polymerase III subunit gamma/tau [Rhodothermales bacterium]
MSDTKYLVAARKYRPQRFDEVVAQEHVCDTVKNAIAQNRLGHAYLFSGPRGVGKTTVARILAKSINCTAPADERDGSEPCLKCESCLSFAEGRNLNVIEIDAASNNKVDDVRELRDTVRIPPQGGLKKVYIVDEVHMLTSQAFNALLKTLEEPPPYVLFIFATTEPNKVLPTILSRCQRFDFRRIAVPEIVERLEQICQEESITADEASLLLIARKGDGALRDALSVFDQAVALCGENVTYDVLAEALGVVDIELFFELTNYVHEKNPAGVLNLVQGIVASGFDFREFLTGLAEHLRNLFVAVTMSDTRLIETAAATRERYAVEAGNFNRSMLLRLLTIASDTDGAIRNSTRPRLQLELGLLKMTAMADSIDLRQVIQKIDQIQGTPAAPVTGQEPATPTVHKSTTRPTTKAPARKSAAKAASVSSPLPDTGKDGTPESPAPAEPPAEKPAARTAKTPAPEQNTTPLIQPAVAPVEEQETALPARPLKPAPVEPTDAPPAESSKPKTSSAPGFFDPPALSRHTSAPKKNGGTIEGSAARSTTPLAPIAMGDAQKVSEWLPFVMAVKSDRIHVGSLLQHAAPRDMSDGHIEIDVPDDFHKRLLENQQDFLLKHARGIIADSVQSLRFSVQASVKPPSGETASDFDPYEYMQQKRKDNPVIRAIFDEFGGELVW